MPSFQRGDRVRWVMAVTGPGYKDAVGTVEDVQLHGVRQFGENFALYIVRFEFGSFPLYGTQIEAATQLEIID